MASGSYVMMRIIPSSLMISSIQLKYYAWDISHKKSVSDDSRFTGVLSEARVDLNPHQVEAALFAFKSPLSNGAILADEVGLGKTIEAGIILSEMWAENKRKNIPYYPPYTEKPGGGICQLYEKDCFRAGILSLGS